jgi:teichuronic acid biosynthesis glycosyltransferase TuaC
LNGGNTSQRQPLKVLVLSRSYPNSVLELLGLWVEGPVRHSTKFCEPKVISPAPYCPPLPGLPESYSRFRQVEKRCFRNGIEVFYPRLFTGPGYTFYNVEWLLYELAVRKLAGRIRKAFPFDLIHAHFTYPDGVVAARLGRRFGVPVLITEHAPWEMWANRPTVLRRASWAAREAAFHISVSESVRRSVATNAGDRGNLVVLPNAVNGSVFTHNPGASYLPNQILFAGAVRPVKGVDVLLKAMHVLARSGREVNLVIAGEAFYSRYREEETKLRGMAAELGLGERVRFLGKKTPDELACLMRESAALVLPSRMESFGMVLVEAMACGTPVVSTRSGGPEDVVTPETGVLVAPADAEALAQGVAFVLDRRETYDAARMRAYALRNFGMDSVGDRLQKLYSNAVARFRGQQTVAAGAGDSIAS